MDKYAGAEPIYADKAYELKCDCGRVITILLGKGDIVAIRKEDPVGVIAGFVKKIMEKDYCDSCGLIINPTSYDRESCNCGKEG